MTGPIAGDVLERLCLGGCGTKLSRFTRGNLCAACLAAPNNQSTPIARVRCRILGCKHDAVKESQGVVSGRMRNLCDEHLDDELRLEAIERRTRPTTEGAVQLPGPVPGRERTYEEMIAKPSAPKPAPVETKRCAECDRELPAAATGWLCAECTALEAAEEDKTLPAPAPEPTPEAASEQVKPDEPQRACRMPDCDAIATRYVGERGVYANLCEEHYQARRVRQREIAIELAARRRKPPHIPAAERIQVARVEPSDLDAQLAARAAELEQQLDHISGEQTRLYARWRIANAEWHDVIAEISARARSAA